MNARERFDAVMHFQPVDRIPVWDLENIVEQTIRLWCGQGLPLGVDINGYVGFDSTIPVALSTNPIPNFVKRTIETDEESFTVIDEFGFTRRTLKLQAVGPTTYYYLKGSIENRSDWEAMKKRYDPTDIRRYGEGWGEELLEHYRNAGAPIYLLLRWGPGRGIKNGFMLGLEQFLDKIVYEPELFEDMFEFWAEFLIQLVKPLLEKVKVDFIFLNEDGMAYKNSTIVSPAMYQRIWIPHMRRFIDYVRSHGVEFVGHYTSGNFKPLIPTFLDAGINLFAPLEVAAGIDARELRKEYGKDVLLMGNISREALMRGPEAVDEEFDAKVPAMMEEGGYIPAVDDMILPDISFQSYMHYIKRIKAWRGSAG